MASHIDRWAEDPNKTALLWENEEVIRKRFHSSNYENNRQAVWLNG